jgi:LmbE family N-acetylglucosaminyl deacetylase
MKNDSKIHQSVEDVEPGRYHRVYLSPHLDDAIFSCGGAIAGACAEGLAVLVATVCSAVPPASQELSPLARSLHDRWGLAPAEVVPTRLAEDERALALAGADGLRLGLVDALYRRPPGYDRHETLFGAIAPDDPLPAALRRAVVELASRLPDALFVLPLGVGGHVDHRATHEVATALIAPVAFYEDLPYALDAAAVARRRREVPWPLEARDVDVSRSFATRLESAAAYASQIPSLFGSPADLRTTLERHAAGHGTYPLAERLWVRLPAPRDGEPERRPLPGRALVT